MKKISLYALAFVFVLVGIFNEFLSDSTLLMMNLDQLQGLGSRFLRVQDFWMTQWDDSRLGGIPTLDALFGDAFHPLVLTQWVFDPARAVGVKFIIITMVGFLSATLLFRKLSKNWEWGALLGFLYALNPQFFTHIYGGHDGKMMVFAIAPLAILGLLELVQEGRWRGFFIYQFSVVWMVLSSHLQLTYFFLWGAGLFTIFLIFQQNSGWKLKSLRLAGASLALALALGLTAFQILPPMHYTKTESVRGTAEKTSMGHAVSWSLHPEELASMIVPGFISTDVHKDRTEATDSYWGHNSFKLNQDSAGSVLTLLAFLGLFVKKNRRLAIFFLLGSAIALTYALGANSPLFDLWYQILPGVKNFRAPSMAIFWIPLAMGITASAIYEAIQDKQQRKNLWHGLSLFLALVLLIVIARQAWTSVLGVPLAMAIVGFGAIIAGALSAQDQGKVNSFFNAIQAIGQGFPSLSKLELTGIMGASLLIASTVISPDRIFAQADIAQYFKPLNEIIMNRSGAGVILGAFIITIIATLFAWGITQKPIVLITALVAVSALDLYLIESDYVQNIPRNSQVQENSPIIQGILKDSPDPLHRPRILSVSKDPTISANIFAAYGMRGASGFHDNELARGREFRETIFQIQSLDELSANPYVALYNIGYFVWDTPEGPRVIRTNSNLGDAFIYNQYAKVEEGKAITILTNYPNFRKVALVEQNLSQVERNLNALVSVLPDSQTIRDPSSSVKLVSSLKMDEQTYQTQSVKASLLVVSGNYHPNWKVWIDGNSAPVIRAFGALRAVELPPGKHEVRFQYISNEIHKTLNYMKLSLLITGFLFLLSLYSRFRRKTVVNS